MSGKRYAVCISPCRHHPGPRATNGSADARDREPVGRNFRKFQNDVAPRRRWRRWVCVRRDGHRQTFALLSRSLFTVTYVTKDTRFFFFPCLFLFLPSFSSFFFSSAAPEATNGNWFALNSRDVKTSRQLAKSRMSHALWDRGGGEEGRRSQREKLLTYLRSFLTLLHTRTHTHTYCTRHTSTKSLA